MNKITFNDYENKDFNSTLAKAYKYLIIYDKNHRFSQNCDNIILTLQINFKNDSFTNEISKDKEYQKILKITTKKQADEFQKLFGKKDDKGYIIDGFIYWNKVYKTYNGIDISNFRGKFNDHKWMDNYLFTDGGILWNNNNIASLKVDAF